MKKIISILLAAVMAFAMLAGCGTKGVNTDVDSDFQYIVDKGTMIVGITDYAPMDYKDENGEWTGFDAEFAREVAKLMGVEIEFIEIDWDNKFPELESKSIDCIWNGMTITDEVKLNTECSKAYVKNEQVVVMNADKVENYKDIESLKSLKFAAESGSAGEAAALDNGFTVTAVLAQTDALLEVASGSADACIIDGTMAAAMTGEGTSYANLKAGIALTSEEYGIGFRKGSDMAQKVNEYMAQLTENGVLPALAEKYELMLAD
ncbi:MAG: transporter substrate-binding domain-containing protein [Clostridia bacterium]|nr:transporter substrate-binding domain-containing protein [Clostridia bacterium]